MTPENFVSSYKDAAASASATTGVPAEFILAQAALESGWGAHAPGNNFFGIKAGSSWTGETQLLETTEYSINPDLSFPVIISITPTSNGEYKYTVKDYFRAYASAQDSFTDWANLIADNPSYAAVMDSTSAQEFAQALINAGYSTDPNYAGEINSLINEVTGYISSNPGTSAALGIIVIGIIALLLFK